MEPATVTVRGKDLPGAVKVMPMGLDAAIKKRVSGEFKSEKSGSSLTFASAGPTPQPLQQHAEPGVFKKQMQQQQQSSSFSSEFSSTPSAAFGGTGMSASKQFSAANSSMSSSSSFQQQSSSFQQQSSSIQQQSMSSFSSSQQQKSVTSKQVQLGGAQDFTDHGREIAQTGLKEQLHSAITDIESEIVQDFKENIPANLIKSPTPTKPVQEPFSPTPPGNKYEYFSPPPLEAVARPEPAPIQQPVFSAEPARNQMAPVQPVQPVVQPAAPVAVMPTQMQNGFSSEFSKEETKKEESFTSSFSSTTTCNNNLFSSQQQQQMQATSFQSSQENYQTSKQESFSSTSSNLKVDESGVQQSDSNSSLLQKIMTPASNSDYDSNSLKRRDPRKMFTDSSFYSAKHHPTVADQVEMAHRLTSALFKEENKTSKGQQMYLNRMKKSGEESDYEDYSAPKHDSVPNLKLVMNPGGKVHEWNDIDPAELPNAALLAAHAAAGGNAGVAAAPSLPSPEIVNPMIEDLNSNTGRGGELFAKRRKRAENWVVDEHNINNTKPSAAADLFIQEQRQQQLQFHQQQAQEQAEASAEERQILAQQQHQLNQEREIAQQQFRQQQQIKQTQSFEIRRQQEQQSEMMSDQDVELPPNYTKTSLKGRSFTPSLDLSCHNVQGINVWANTAPRGWGAPKGQQKPNLPTVSVTSATPSVDQQQQLQIQKEEQLKQEQLLLEQQMEKQRLEDQRMMEEQLRIEEEQRMEEERIIQEKKLIEEQQKLEEERIHLEQERQQEQIRIEQERQMEELRLIEEKKKMEEQRIIQEQQQMEELRIIEEQKKMEEQRLIAEQRQLEELRILEEQKKIEEQQMIEQQRLMEEQKMIEEQRMMEQQRLAEQNRLEQQRIEEQKRQSDMQMTKQQESSFSQSNSVSYQQSTESSVQQSISSSYQQQHQTVESFNQIYESAEVGAGLKGYKRKDEIDGDLQVNGQQSGMPKMVQNNGIFGGITGDQNSLLEDDQFDCKKHSVRDLVGHFSKVKPKAQIPVQYLPEQKIYNGDQGPSLNYLNASAEGSSSQSMKVTVSNSKQDISASQREYEMRKQNTSNQTQENTSSSIFETRNKSEMSTEKKQMLNSRRQSLKDLLFFDENNVGSSGGASIIDPSAILRGSEEPASAERLNTPSNIQGKNESNSGKWDNHNTIARGWAGASANYHPVTFRSIYNVDNQKTVTSI